MCVFCAHNAFEIYYLHVINTLISAVFTGFFRILRISVTCLTAVHQLGLAPKALLPRSDSVLRSIIHHDFRTQSSNNTSITALFDRWQWLKASFVLHDHHFVATLLNGVVEQFPASAAIFSARLYLVELVVAADLTLRVVPLTSTRL